MKNDGELFKTSLVVLTKRHESKYYYDRPEEPATVEISEETLAKLPEKLRKGAEEQLRRHQADLKEYTKAKGLWDQIEKAIAESDGKSAFQVLNYRSNEGYEYERISLENFAALEDYGV